MGLTARRCSPELAQPLNEKERERLRQQVPGWRVTTQGDSICLVQDWSTRVTCYISQRLLCSLPPNNPFCV